MAADSRCGSHMSVPSAQQGGEAASGGIVPDLDRPFAMASARSNDKLDNFSLNEETFDMKEARLSANVIVQTAHRKKRSLTNWSR